jgi:hypothetical protein
VLLVDKVFTGSLKCSPKISQSTVVIFPMYAIRNARGKNVNSLRTAVQ